MTMEVWNIRNGEVPAVTNPDAPSERVSFFQAKEPARRLPLNLSESAGQRLSHRLRYNIAGQRPSRVQGIRGGCGHGSDTAGHAEAGQTGEK